MPVAFPSKDYDPEEILHLLAEFEQSLVEKSFPSIQTYSSAIDDFIKKNVVPDLEPFFRTITQNIQMFVNESDESIVGVHEGLRAVMKHLDEVSGKIEDNFLPFLQEGSFLVHGDSELLASVLEDCLHHNPNVDILILEGLPSSSGINLLKRLKDSPVVKNNPEYLKRLLLAPDSSAFRLLQRRKCNFILFGAHAVTPHGCLVNSAGSLQLATLAKESNVAVYSLCPTFKFYLSMQRMPLSSDDLDVLGNALPSGGSACNNNIAASSTSQGSSPTHRSSRIEGDSPLNNDGSMMGRPTNSQVSRNSPSIQVQQQQQSLNNASFSGPPPSIQISPQLKPTPGSGLSGNTNNNNTVSGGGSKPPPQLPPFVSNHSSKNGTPTQEAASAAISSSGNNNNNSINVSSSNKNGNNNSSNSNSSNMNLFLPQAMGGGQQLQSCGTSSVPKISPVLGATSPLNATNTFLDMTNNNSTMNGSIINQQAVRGSTSTPSQMTTMSNTHYSSNNNPSIDGNQQQQQEPAMINHFAPTCAFQLDLVGADKITHFFTEHGVVMPWSVADKISKIFLKEIQNKRKVHRTNNNNNNSAGGNNF